MTDSVIAYKGDEIAVQRTPVEYHDSLGPFTFIVRTGSGCIQTYLTRDELLELSNMIDDLL